MNLVHTRMRSLASYVQNTDHAVDVVKLMKKAQICIALNRETLSLERSYDGIC